jgi:phytoene dehydrogenase-like protein
MKTLAPGDAAVTEEFCQAARRFARFSETMDMVTEPAGLIDRISMGARVLPHIGALRKYGRMSIQAFAARFRDPFMREAFATLFDLPDFPMLAMLMTIGWMHNRDAGYPIGGSLAFAQAIERRYLDLGGKINYRSRVEKILVEDVPGTDDRQQARAVGVRLTDGSEHRADAVISAADGRATIFDMLDRGFINDEIRGYYEELPIFQPMVQVSLGVARDLSDEPHAVIYPLTEPITVAGKVHRRLAFRHLCYDPSMAPAGKSVVIVGFESDYDFWKDLDQERERYDAEKQQVAIAVIDQLEKRLPGITGQIEAVDVATPMTTERYTGNWQGSIEGWLITTRTVNMMMGRGMSKTLPGLRDFYMAGQWVEPGGGLPSAALSGRKAIQMVCKCAGKPFQAQLP